MNRTIQYISRHRLPKYNSIEELFNTIQKQTVEHFQIQKTELPHPGGSPKILFKNLRSLTKGNSYLNHITGDVHYMAIKTGKKTVLTIHDIQSAFGGSYFRRIYILLFWFWLPAIFVGRITVISEFTKKELQRIIPFAKNKIRVVYNPVHPLISFRPKEFNPRNPTILLMGTKPNKNLERSLQALRNIECELLIIGLLTDEQSHLLESSGFRFTNKSNLSFEEIVECYYRADILCFPSTYEGFGMPIIEAQATGRAVLTSGLGAMKEVAGEGAYLVDPYDVDEIRVGIETLINNEALRNKMILQGRDNVSRFNPQEIANGYIEVYKELEKK